MSPDIRSGLRPPLTPRWRRFAILAALASEAGSHGTGNPSRINETEAAHPSTARRGHDGPAGVKQPARPEGGPL